MKLFISGEANGDGFVEIKWHGTRQLAQQHVKETVIAPHRGSMRVAEVVVKTDKGVVLAILNREDPEYVILRVWKVTARGGLTLIP